MTLSVSVAAGEGCCASMKLLGLLQSSQISFELVPPQKRRRLLSQSIYKRAPLLLVGGRIIEDFPSILFFVDRVLKDGAIERVSVEERVKFFNRLEVLDREIFEPLIDNTFQQLKPLPTGCSRLTAMLQWQIMDKTRKALAFTEMSGAEIRSLFEKLIHFRNERTLAPELAHYEDGMTTGVLRECLFREGRFASILDQFPDLSALAIPPLERGY